MTVPSGTTTESAGEPVPIRHVLPVNRETRWSDLLAVLIEAAPNEVLPLLGLAAESGPVSVRREVQLRPGDRLDLLIDVAGTPRAAIEVKVLSGIGNDQLARYAATLKSWDVRNRVLIAPERLVVDLGAEVDWRGITWETLLDALMSSRSPWVVETARAWLAHLDEALPKVDGSTRWNDIATGTDLGIALRARMSFVFGKLDWMLRPTGNLTCDLVSSSAGNSAVVRMHQPAAREGYRVIAEAEERRSVRQRSSGRSADASDLRGPMVRVALLQENVRTSESFDWGYLHSLWKLKMAAARSDWETASARLRDSTDRENWQAMVNAGGPKHLGSGFGNAQAMSQGECMFGAKFQLAPNATLDEIAEQLFQTSKLVREMAACYACESS